jgi:hypothetical protein
MEKESPVTTWYARMLQSSALLGHYVVKREANIHGTIIGGMILDLVKKRTMQDNFFAGVSKLTDQLLRQSWERHQQVVSNMLQQFYGAQSTCSVHQ